MGAYPVYVEFWAVFYFCSDVPNFWHVSYKIIVKHFSVSFFHWFSLRFQEITYAKTVKFPS